MLILAGMCVRIRLLSSQSWDNETKKKPGCGVDVQQRLARTPISQHEYPWDSVQNRISIYSLPTASDHFRFTLQGSMTGHRGVRDSSPRSAGGQVIDTCFASDRCGAYSNKPMYKSAVVLRNCLGTAMRQNENLKDPPIRTKQPGSSRACRARIDIGVDILRDLLPCCSHTCAGQ